MPTEPDMDIFERLKASEPAGWSSYVDHAFVRQMYGQRSLLFMLDELCKTMGVDVPATPVEIKYLAWRGRSHVISAMPSSA